MRTTTAPISIDTAEFSQLAAEPDTATEISGLREQFAGRTLLLGVDRLDYTRGIIERLLAVEALLDRRPDLRTKEYVTAQQALGGSGSMIPSEFAGAGSELREAIPCNPFDTEGLSLRMEHALELQPDVRRAAITAMAAQVKSHDVHRWVAGQLADIAAASRSPRLPELAKK